MASLGWALCCVIYETVLAHGALAHVSPLFLWDSETRHHVVLGCIGGRNPNAERVHGENSQNYYLYKENDKDKTTFDAAVIFSLCCDATCCAVLLCG